MNAGSTPLPPARTNPNPPASLDRSSLGHLLTLLPPRTSAAAPPDPAAAADAHALGPSVNDLEESMLRIAGELDSALQQQLRASAAWQVPVTESCPSTPDPAPRPSPGPAEKSRTRKAALLAARHECLCVISFRPSRFRPSRRTSGARSQHQKQHLRVALLLCGSLFALQAATSGIEPEPAEPAKSKVAARARAPSPAAFLARFLLLVSVARAAPLSVAVRAASSRVSGPRH